MTDTTTDDLTLAVNLTPEELADVAQACHREADKIHADMARARQHIEGVWGVQRVPAEVQRALAWAEDRGVYEHHNLHDMGDRFDELLAATGPHEATTHA